MVVSGVMNRRQQIPCCTTPLLQTGLRLAPFEREKNKEKDGEGFAFIMSIIHAKTENHQFYSCFLQSRLAPSQDSGGQ
ncbi:hypothetical protein [Cellvibrio sp. pealriver]|uniref:hypothetical protein n=1 Tax=Cellvibrio sp. pealriver TaxID=1622269 RepID=UPI00066FFA09|nr:hypothetical protein [Cellvibrio sp. pealriver]